MVDFNSNMGFVALWAGRDSEGNMHFGINQLFFAEKYKIHSVKHCHEDGIKNYWVDASGDINIAPDVPVGNFSGMKSGEEKSVTKEEIDSKVNGEKARRVQELRTLIGLLDQMTDKMSVAILMETYQDLLPIVNKLQAHYSSK